MFRKINLVKADGETADFSFLANATTAIRYQMVFGKDLMESIMSVITAAGMDNLAKLMAAGAAEGTDIDLNNINPELMEGIIKIVGCGEMDAISKLAFIMNRQAEKADMRSISFEDYIEWLEQFDTMVFLTQAMDFISIYMGNRATESTVKKNQDQQTAK